MLNANNPVMFGAGNNNKPPKPPKDKNKNKGNGNGNGKGKESLAARLARYKRLSENPGTRAAVPLWALSKAHRAKRLLNQSLDTPVTEGSQLTRRGLAHQRKAAEVLEFGQNPIGDRSRQQQELMGQHDAWIRQLQAAEAQQRQAQETANHNARFAVDTAHKDIEAAGGEQDPERADRLRAMAQTRYANAADMANYVATTGQGAMDRASDAANRLAPIEKMRALAEFQRGTNELKSKIGAWRTQFNEGKISREQESALARSIAGQKDKREQDRMNLDREKLAQNAKDRALDREMQQGVNESKVDYQRRMLELREQQAGGGKSGGGKKGGRTYQRTPDSWDKTMSALSHIKTRVTQAKNGDPWNADHGRQKPLDRNGAVKKVKENMGGTYSDAMVAVVADAVYRPGHEVHPNTIDRLAANGFSRSQIKKIVKSVGGRMPRGK